MTPIQNENGGHVNAVDDSTIQQAQANTLQAIQSQCSAFNVKIKADYLTTFGNWAISVSAGRMDSSNPPKPPASFVVGYFTDPTTGGGEGAYPNTKVQWAFPSQTGPAVCDMPPIPASKPYVPPVLEPPANIRNVPLGDTMPVGFVLTATDGVKWQKQSSPTPFGTAYFYARISIMLLMLGMIAASPARAQVKIACSSQPMAATRSIGEQSMVQLGCWLSNAGSTSVVLTPSQFYTAVIQLNPVTPNVAAQIINDSINRLPQSKLVKVGQIGLALSGVAATIYTGNSQWSLIGGLVSQNAPAMIKLVANEIPSAAPFTGGQLSGPVTLLPGGDVPPVVLYAMKGKKAAMPGPLVVTVP